ncbi:hypothetical protein KL929_001251 [Ogataea haglerorum]|uniref:uncharacterized protein n=1 Tax=Ogataea haglerorum TaxID=1937702 RepID=UPI001C8AB45D|nr:uncharacterized protein KL911_001679 [Ogataea haglerorum]KAG7721296.1 hypothetical protein KL913_001032 [Ogataea haglerorum]KAG7722050.1 hypothetical protein KL949_001028 [Ogataea haglerorum]KAG7744513.1 hypothetical protein KL932_001029 [Ogataea haglerorum]KAG7755622.1 hypothetical protein KL911_001679 [Ogataea haglerorum]KAG7770379.1 hypothetical protein KL931_002143 [Ogataea haglerorum]
MSRESSITVAVRIRPFTSVESSKLLRSEPDNPENTLDGHAVPQNTSNRLLLNNGIRKILNAVDDRMLIFDPSDTNPLVQMEQNVFSNTFNSGDKRHTSSIGKHSSRIREHRFVFDKLFDEDTTQTEVYEFSTKPLLDSVLDGFNATIFAYGATGCGKTFTISGTPENPGIIFLAMQDLFNRIKEMEDTQRAEITLSYFEIYNETIRDLLDPSTDPRSLILREDESKRITVANLSTHTPNSVDEVMDLIIIGNKNRTVSPTEANSTSSRSHAILQINVLRKPRTADLNEEHTYATLSFIDLAGSERASATRNKGARLHEGANINKSLLALGNCINALCDPRKHNHVPYRDSKLTRLLKFSLGGNCKTFMIVCVSPSSRHYDETLNTLKYADRAKEIRTKLTRNQHNLSRHVGSYLKMITEQKREIEELRSREDKMIKVGIDKYTKSRQRCLQKLREAMMELQRSLQRNQQSRLQKAYILAERKFLLLQRHQIQQLLVSFENRFGPKEDLTDIDMFVPGFSELIYLCEDISEKLEQRVKELEAQYSKPNELDFIIKDSSASLLRSLTELDTWSDEDTKLYEAHLLHLKDSVEKAILFDSSIVFDRSIKNFSSFNFVFETLQRATAILLDISSDNEDALVNVSISLREMVMETKVCLSRLLEDGGYVHLDTTAASTILEKQRKPETLELATTPVKQAKRLSSSPLTKGFAKLNRLDTNAKSLQNRSFSDTTVKQAKKVRWEVPYTEDSDVSMSEGTAPRKYASSPLRESQKLNEPANSNKLQDIAPTDIKLTSKPLHPSDNHRSGGLSPVQSSMGPGLGSDGKFQFGLTTIPLLNSPEFKKMTETSPTTEHDLDESMMALDSGSSSENGENKG